MSGFIEIVAIQLSKRLVVLNDGSCMPIVRMVDEEGDDTNDEDEAIVIVVEGPQAYYTVDLRDQKKRTLH